jgi:RNase P subunit RPR2
MRNEGLRQSIALQRIQILFGLAKKNSLNNQDRAKRYCYLLSKISSHYRIGLPKEMQRQICNKCYRVFVPGLNCNVKIASANRFVSYNCVCGKETHMPY